MLSVTLAALMMFAQEPAAASPPQAAASAEVQEPTRLEDIDVVGRTLDTMIRDFVGEVAAPNRGRGIARWEDAVCIGAANLQRDAAQYIVDRVSTVAEDLGLTPGVPGCAPNVMIVASDDPSSFAAKLVETRARAFRMGGSGMDRGGAALRAFQTSNKPVRWWQQSMPVNSETGERAVRIPGECANACSSPYDYAPVIDTFAASRLTSQIADNIFRTIVVVDVNQTSRVSVQQLADYIAMVTFAQIDPEADTSRYASVLNVFDAPEAADGLTDWDTAYLKGLYDAERTRKNVRAGTSEIRESIRRTHQELRAETEPQP